jgi:hypothetical protein
LRGFFGAGLELRSHRRLEAIRPADLSGRRRRHAPHALGHRRPHHALERVEIAPHVCFRRPQGVDDDGERLDPGGVGREEKARDTARAFAERDDLAFGTERAPIARADEEQPALDGGQCVGGLRAGLEQCAEVERDAEPGAPAVERFHEQRRIAPALERDADRELVGQLLDRRERRRVRVRHARDDDRRIDGLRQLEDFAGSRLALGHESVHAVGRDLLVQFPQAVDNGVALAGPEPGIERLGHLDARQLRARRFHARDAHHIGLRERFRQRQALDRRRGHRHAPAEPDVGVLRAAANRAQARSCRPLRHRRYLRPLLTLFGDHRRRDCKERGGCAQATSHADAHCG